MSAARPDPSAPTWERRGSRRLPVPEATPLIATTKGRLYRCKLVDVSLTGARLGFDSDMPTGSVIALDHPLAGTLCGACIWRDSEAMGVQWQMPGSELERALKCVSLVL